MTAIYQLFHVLGSLGLLVYGMRLLSDGVQRVAGDRLQSILNYVTANRFAAVLTGFLVTVLVQSSSATTVMIVSFVNASLLSLTQAIGAIMGANIGTTVTGWVIALLGFSVDISAGALPAVGLGAILIFSKRLRRPDLGETLLGFGLLFLGLSFLKDAVPDISAHPEILERIAALSGRGMLSVLLFVGIGALLTVIVQSSSAAVTITLTMAYAGWIDFPVAAAIILGENIGTTVTANLAAMGGTVNGRRAARAHLVFNALGVLWMFLLFPQALRLVHYAAGSRLLPTQLALFHTGFNLVNTAIFIWFVPVLANLAVRMVPDTADAASLEGSYQVPIPTAYAENHPELYLLELRYEVVQMSRIVESMIADSWKLFQNPEAVTEEHLLSLKQREDYTDQMQEKISAVLASFGFQASRESTTAAAIALLRIVDELESVADSSYNIALAADRCQRKKLEISPEALQELEPYAQRAIAFTGLVDQRLLTPGSDEDLRQAKQLEEEINALRNVLKKSSRHRIQQGADLKGELLVLDVISHLEHMGDYALNIAEAIRHMNARVPLLMKTLEPRPDAPA
ncbi:phosphate:Na+ symporter [Alkalispirochaeta americana]|uniref:Phosphate:Na+ symporter n=1 Tax=Alkalispirochaeta americana TaxID=159291 RepID=A0A1N6RIN2_9SPIO|nr:Na/Pi cotransporter family protein [Alkalispirochaeta americana]SIQ28691.1 phosphate:Na+ symporter [Alkalispirochaeta americana]